MPKQKVYWKDNLLVIAQLLIGAVLFGPSTVLGLCYSYTALYSGYICIIYHKRKIDQRSYFSTLSTESL